jgi:hypothetical protein
VPAFNKTKERKKKRERKEKKEKKGNVTTMTHPQSLSKPVDVQLQKRGVKVVRVDLRGPFDKLLELHSGIDVVISTIFFNSLDDEIPLADAAKAAGVKRFAQSALMIVRTPRRVVDFREKVKARLCPVWMFKCVSGTDL